MRAVGGLPGLDEGKRHRADLLCEDAHEDVEPAREIESLTCALRISVTGKSTSCLSGSSLEEAGAFSKAKRKRRKRLPEPREPPRG